MWMIDPKLLCRQHLLGEHSELHKFIPSFNKKYKINNRVSPVVQIELSNYEKRHNDLAAEMLRRGFNHKSPLTAPDFSYLPLEQYSAKVDINISLQDLVNRCSECKNRINSL